MGIAGFLLRRIAQAIPTLLFITVITFVLARLVPGDPARLAAGMSATQEQIDAIAREYGLDQPAHIQYFNYLKDLLAGDLGDSLTTRHSVGHDLALYLPATLELSAVGMLLALAVAMPLAIVSALHRDGPIDQVSRLLSLSGAALPRYWFGFLLQLVFAANLGVLPLGGRIDPDLDLPWVTGFLFVDATLAGNWEALGSVALHSLLPAVTLALAPLAIVTRMMRAGMLETLSKDFVRGLRANGVPERVILFKYVLRSALTDTWTVIGLGYVWLLGGSVLVEAVFDWPGLGLYAVQSALTNDFQPIMGITLVYGILVLVVNFVIDLGYLVLDPRIREA